MSKLVRQLPHPQRWTKAFDPDPASRILHPELLLDVIEAEREASFWRLGDSVDELPRLAVAVCCLKGNLSPFSALLLEEDLVVEAGLNVVDDPADTADAGMNQRHVNIKLPDVSSSLKLAELLLNESSYKIVSKLDLMKEIRSQLDSTNISAAHKKFQVTESNVLYPLIDDYRNSIIWMDRDRERV